MSINKSSQIPKTKSLYVCVCALTRYLCFTKSIFHYYILQTGKTIIIIY